MNVTLIEVKPIISNDLRFGCYCQASVASATNLGDLVSSPFPTRQGISKFAGTSAVGSQALLSIVATRLMCDGHLLFDKITGLVLTNRADRINGQIEFWKMSVTIEQDRVHDFGERPRSRPVSRLRHITLCIWPTKVRKGSGCAILISKDLAARAVWRANLTAGQRVLKKLRN